MTAYRISVIELGDLVEVSVTCHNCSVKVTLKAETSPIPEQCPSCNKVFDDGLKNALAALARMHREAKGSKNTLEFTIRET